MSRSQGAITALITVWLIVSHTPCPAQTVRPAEIQTENHARISFIKRAGLSPGEAVIVEVETREEASTVSGNILGKSIVFWREDTNRFRGLIGLDRDVTPGIHPMKLSIVTGDDSSSLITRELEVEKRNFEITRLSVKAKAGGLTKDDLERIRREKALVDSTLSQVYPDRLWHTDFGPPLDLLTVTGDFGSQRIINGRKRNPHGGLDLRAKAGAPVKASNDGIVALCGDHFYTGNCVYLDHGLGVFSMYFHLSEILVENGEHVKKGQVIGRVGSTGRSTGPHLHWAFTINRARIDPVSMLTLPVE